VRVCLFRHPPGCGSEGSAGPRGGSGRHYALTAPACCRRFPPVSQESGAGVTRADDPAPDERSPGGVPRRTVIGAGGAAALGVSTFLLPSAAVAASALLGVVGGSEDGTEFAGAFAVRTFTSTGSFTVPDGITSVDVLLVGGGGAGGKADFWGGGGGGGGQVRVVTGLAVTPGDDWNVTVGAGGLTRTGFSYGAGGDGAASSFVRGATSESAAGGKGGLASDAAPGGTGGASGSGSAGGAGNSGTGNKAGGGGGGQGGAGDAWRSVGGAVLAGDGGSGVDVPGFAVRGGALVALQVSGGGGGAAANASFAGGDGGDGGGGAGRGLGVAAVAGVAGTGGGGGGTDGGSDGQAMAGNGGSGLVVVRYAAS
jgi:hypothetical protein